MPKMITELSVLTVTRKNRIPTLLMGLMIVSCLTATTATAQLVSNGDIFLDHFDGPAGALPATGDWAQVVGAAPQLDGTTLLSNLNTGFARSTELDFSGSPDEWFASTRFQVNGKLFTQNRGATFPRQYHLLSGTNSPNPLGADTWEVIGVDVRLEMLFTDTDGTADTYDMTWHGWDTHGFRNAQTIAGGSGLNKGQFYTVTAHRKPDDTVDIFLDGFLIDTKPLLVGIIGGTNTGQENPNRLQFGDISGGGVQIDDVTFDFFSVGSESLSDTVTEFQWKTDDLGSWTTGTNWTPFGGPPETRNDTAVFGTQINIPTTVVTNKAVTVNRIEFNNTVNNYAVAGLGSVNLRANTAGTPVDPTMTVQGTHLFQAPVHLHDNTVVDVASDSTLTFDGALSLMGNTLTKTGVGTLAINNQLSLGGGTLVGDQGTISGSGTVGGNVHNDSGTISPGNSLLAVAVVPEPSSGLVLLLGAILVPCVARGNSRGQVEAPRMRAAGGDVG